LASFLVVRLATAVAVCTLVGAPAAAEPAKVSGQTCVDQEIANRLAVKRRRRGHQDLLFIKQARHELSALGGTYVSDLYSSTYVVGGAYTFHMTEDAAVEIAGAVTHAKAELIRALEDGRGQVLVDTDARTLFFESLLLWSPVHGKLRLGGNITHFDVHLAAGVGVVDAQTSRGAAGVGGMGVKLFFGRAIALRIDARDHVFRQELLDRQFLVNDVSVTLGLSLFLPWRN
jgi:outer membrane beta-barrel protein